MAVAASAVLAACTANGGPQPPTSGGGGSTAFCVSEIAGGGSTADSSTTAGTCTVCSITDVPNVVDTDPNNFALFDITLALLGGSGEITVRAPPGVVYPAGNIAGFTLSIPKAALASATVLPTLVVKTFLNGVFQENVTYSNILDLDLLGLLGNDAKFFVGIQTTKDFDAIQIEDRADAAGVAGQLRVYDGCSTATGVGALPVVIAQ